MSYTTDLKRKKLTDKISGGYSNTEMRYNDEAGASKSINSEGLMIPVGLASTSFTTLTAVPGQMVCFFNSLATALYVAFDDGTSTAVAALGTGYPLRPLDYTYLIVPPGIYAYKVSGSGAAIFDVADSSYLG